MTANARFDIGLLTQSFAGDFELCRILCQTVDRHAPFEHLLVVPRRDLALFAPLAGPRRRILTDEEFLPRWMARAPLPGPAWRRRLGLPRRDVYLTPFSAPVRGWIVQQILKIAAVSALSWDAVLHVDSDAAFVRPLAADRLVRGGATRLYRAPDAERLASHLPWHTAAGRLLGLGPVDYLGADYIDNLVTWSPALARAMAARIESVAGMDWRRALARQPAFSEYILYGAFCDAVLGDAAPVFRTDRSLALARWTGALDEADEAAFLEGLEPHHVAVAVQSTLGLSPARRAALVARGEAAAARADASRRGRAAV